MVVSLICLQSLKSRGRILVGEIGESSGRRYKAPAVGVRPRLMDKSVLAEQRVKSDWDCGCGGGPHRYFMFRCPNRECRMYRRHASTPSPDGRRGP